MLYGCLSVPMRPTGAAMMAQDIPDWVDDDQPICQCGHSADWHRGPTGRCQFTLDHCTCLAFQEDPNA
jgi:hypothetical protein